MGIAKKQYKPGVYPGLSYEEYDAIDAYRRTVILEGRRSLDHLRYAEENGDTESSEALDFGQALHCATLEPDRFENTVVLGAVNPKTGEPYGADTKAQNEFRDENPGKIVVSKGYREKLLGMGSAIRNHPRAGALIRASVQTELTAVWKDEPTGVMCKVRLDAYLGRSFGIVDLKSTLNASPEAFPRSLYDYGYHIQAAMSIDGWKALRPDEPVPPFTIIAVEKEPPYAVACYVVGDDSLEIGRQEYREVLHAIANARRTGIWPSYPTDIMQIDVPEWARKRFADAAA